MSTSNQPRTVAKQFYEEVLNQRQKPVLDEIVADDFVGHECLDDNGFNTYTKRKARKGINEMEKATPDFNYTIDDLVAEDDTVAIRWTFEGTHQGKIMGVPATGKKLEYPGMHFLKVENGVITESWEISDDLAVLSQLGML